MSDEYELPDDFDPNMIIAFPPEESVGLVCVEEEEYDEMQATIADLRSQVTALKAALAEAQEYQYAPIVKPITCTINGHTFTVGPLGIGGAPLPTGIVVCRRVDQVQKGGANDGE